MNYDDLSEFTFGSPPNTDIGHVDQVYLAQSTNEQRNLNASSGGLIKEAIKYYFDTGKIEGVIALKHIDGITYRPVLITDVGEVDNLPGSIYHNIDFSDALKILKETDRKIALIANPCQLEGIFSYIKLYEPELKSKIVLTIGLICGWTYSHHALKAICAYEKVSFSKLTDISYRGGGSVGKLKLFEGNGRVTKVHRRISFKYQAAFDRSYNLARCHFCVNHGNFLADLVVGDAWLPSTVKTRTGISLLIARTAALSKDLHDMKEKDLIKLLQVRADEVIESQTHRVVYGDFSYPYADFVRENAAHSPELSGPNKAECQPYTREQIEDFHRNFVRKVKLQRQGKYWKLFFLKYTKEFSTVFMRYFRWFMVRIVKIKSLSGQRKEIPSEHMKLFQ